MGKSKSIADRMKDYENVSRYYLTKRSPVIIRIDGRAFHSFTKGFKRPFDPLFMETMAETAKALCDNITGCKLAYTQSDEISLLLTDYETTETEPWFENNLQKIVSVSASIATLAFNRCFAEKCNKFIADNQSNTKADVELTAYCSALTRAMRNGGTFDARAFILPKDEVVNYFIWRQQDATRNSILMVAQSLFSHVDIQGVTCDGLQEKMFSERGVNWNDLPIPQKRGTCVIKRTVKQNDVERRKWIIDYSIPVFTKDRDYIDALVM